MAKFKAGDKVRCIRKWHAMENTEDVRTVASVSTNSQGWEYLKLVELLHDHTMHNFQVDRYELVAAAPVSVESDPTGKGQHEPGAKVDAGKVRPSLIVEGMARALWAVSKVATFGAAKYTDGGWILVPNGETRYADAGYRHVLRRAMGEDLDPDSEELHLAHEAWNALAKLDLHLRSRE